MWRRQSVSGAARHDLRLLIWAVCGRVLLLLAFCVLNRTVTPHIRNITEAEMLSHYRRPRRDSIVPSWLMMTIIILVPLLLFTLPTLIMNRILDVTHVLLGWSLAITVNAVVTEVLKLAIGRPRPDYFYRCFPDGRTTKGLCCTGISRELMEGRKSFPSGHSSFSFCSLGFLSFWLCGRLGVVCRFRRRSGGEGGGGGGAVRAGLCAAAPLLLAALIAASRCLDNHHHWQDVVAGALLGLLVAHICYKHYYNPITSQLSGLPLYANQTQRATYPETAFGFGDIISDYLFRSRSYSNVYFQIK